MAANVSSEPRRAVRIPVSVAAAQAKVLFEDRQVPVKDGCLLDDFDALGTHAYTISAR